MTVLGVETTCDETSIALVRDGREVLCNLVSSQVDLHARYGGVVPEVAARRHVEMLNPLLDEALSQSGRSLADVDAVAVANRPGLMGALLTGVAAAKALALVLGVPLVGVHHLESHVYANFLVQPDLQFPLVCLIVSGGHSDLVLMRGHGWYETLGRTRDDAAGEAFDKIARALGLGYPGGPIVDRLARGGSPDAFPFPRAHLGDSLDFSFSGLKTSLLTFLRGRGLEPVTKTSHHQSTGPTPADLMDPQTLADVAASFQEAIVDPLVANAARAVQQTGARTVLLCGGVAANARLRAKLAEAGDREGFEVVYPPISLCTDNAAMSACAGYYRLARGEEDGLALETYATAPMAKDEA